MLVFESKTRDVLAAADSTRDGWFTRAEFDASTLTTKLNGELSLTYTSAVMFDHIAGKGIDLVPHKAVCDFFARVKGGFDPA